MTLGRLGCRQRPARGTLHVCMHACVCVRVCVCVCVCTYMWLHACMYGRMHVYAWVRLGRTPHMAQPRLYGYGHGSGKGFVWGM